MSLVRNALRKMGKFVNSYQSPEERKYKYHTLRELGATLPQARRWRDWTVGHIMRIAIPQLEIIK